MTLVQQIEDETSGSYKNMLLALASNNKINNIKSLITETKTEQFENKN